MKIFPLCILFCLMAGILNAQTEFQAKSISIFKDGSAFYLKETKVTPKAGKLEIPVKSLPKAGFGTLWFNAPSGDLKRISSFTKETTTLKKDTLIIKDAVIGRTLAANKGKKVKLFLDEESYTSGVVEGVLGGVVNLKTTSEWMSIPLGEIHHVSYFSQPSTIDTLKITERKEKKNERMVELDFGKSSSKQDLEMMYLQRDLGWLPSYKIHLLTDETARLELRALMVNDAEDIENTDIQFVVGVPNFKYAVQNSPFTSNVKIDDFLSRINRGGQNPGGGAFSNFANRAQTISYGIEQPSAATGEAGTGVEGIADEDLYFYQQKNVSLKKGGRAYFNILSAEVPIKHIYEVKLTANTTNQRYSNAFSFEENYKNKVWHSIKLTNKTIHPWTTGSAMVTKSQGQGLTKAISQDKMKYTPIKGETFLKITIAPDVSVRDSEKEIAREERKTKVNNYYYDLVTIEGKIKLKNYKDKKIALNVKRSLTGNIQKSNPDWLVASKVSMNGQLNDVQEICWELELDKGEKKEVTYSYKIYVRR